MARIRLAALVGAGVLGLAALTAGLRAGEDPPRVERVRISPDGKSLAVNYSRGKNTFIYVVEVATGKATRLTRNLDATEIAGSFTPDGKQLLYTNRAALDQQPRIYFHNLTTGAETSWGDVSGQDSSPTLSPDGKTMVFARYGHYGNSSPIAQPHGHAWDFWAADADGSHVRQITSKSFYEVSAPSISRDGKRIAFLCDFDDKPDAICIHSLESPEEPEAEVRPKIPKAAEKKNEPMNDPNFSKDGQSIIFLAADPGKHGFDYNVFRVDWATQVVEQLTQGNGYTTSLSLSADGKTAAMVRWQSNWRAIPTTSAVWMLDVETRQMRELKITGLD